MTEPDKPKLSAGGLVTLAFLKARLDVGGDHIDTFLPLLLDVLPRLSNRNFTAAEAQEALVREHGVAMPQMAVTTLLKRLTRQQLLIRDAGRFRLSDDKTFPKINVTVEKAVLEKGQLRLGEALVIHGNRRGLSLESPQLALDYILRFLQEEQISILLGAAINGFETQVISRRASSVIAEFIHDVVGNDTALSSVLQGILEGLVVYRAAFLPDMEKVRKGFKDLTIVFDSMLIRHALGFEGESARHLIIETIELLKDSGVRCVVFDKSVQEIQRILSMYEQKLATPEGRRSLRPVPMARHFLTERFSPSDVQEISALLEINITSVGLRILPSPPRVYKTTHGEENLAQRLADPSTQDITEPRVQHDVDCIAGVLTLRRGNRSRMIEDAKAIFATTSILVIQHVKNWWEEDEHEQCLPPVAHIRSLANLAWIKKPTINPAFQLHELIALCAAGMKPSQRTWQRFLNHLEKLRVSERLSTDEATAIVISAMSDRLLYEAEIIEDDPDDIDTGTLDEVVDRVISQYSAEAEKSILEVTQKYEQKMAEEQATERARTRKAEEMAKKMAEGVRQRELIIDKRVQKWSTRIVGLFYWLIVIGVLVGAVAVITSHHFSGLFGYLIFGGVILFVILELFGILGHLKSFRAKLEFKLQCKLRAWLDGEAASIVIDL